MAKKAKELDIGDLRAQIDALDDKMSALFEKRMEIARDIALYKKQNGLEVLNAKREKEILERLCAKCDVSLSWYLSKFYENVFALSREYQTACSSQKKYGLIGRNLVYSFSKEIHAGFADYDYQLVNLEPDDFAPYLESHALAGCNVTIPYKRDAAALCAKLSDQAQKIGSVNTVIVQEDGALYGDNTDYYGFLYMARRAGVDFSGKKVLVFGNGATSATVCAAVSDCGGEVTVISRSGKENYASLPKHYGDAQILINTTPVGTFPETENQIAEIRNFAKCEAVLDVVYNPLCSHFVQQGMEMGVKASGGLPMLVAQAKRSCELFTGREIADGETEKLIGKIMRGKQNIVLIGMPGCGKTTLCSIVAEKLGREIIDIDAEIEKSEGRTIPEIFARFGEEYFRARECEVIAEKAKLSGAVIATGGGAVLSARNQRNLRQNGFIVFVERDLEKLATGGRPLSQRNGVQALYSQRLPLYRSLADVAVDNNGSAEDAAAEILRRFAGEAALRGAGGGKGKSRKAKN